ncbi:MAG TPA: SusC/RagA family TonB-linked outer membrane protein [Chitinophagaceae bacterium]|nr:SusC/RagA family TonB-linked outer membrane protein [Chitinophagaceae bacterium]
MKPKLILLFTFSLFISLISVSQTVTLSVKDAPMKLVLKEIHNQTGLNILVDEAIIEKIGKVTLDVQNRPVSEVLDICIKNRGLAYSIIDGTLIIREVTSSQPPNDNSRVEVSGRVTDEDGNPLVGASVVLKGTNIGTAANDNGQFILHMPAQKKRHTLEVSSIGYEKMERDLKLTDTLTRLTIALKKTTGDVVLDEIQTTAYSKTSMRFSTGDITTIKSEEIERNPVANVLQALQGRAAGMFITEQTGMPNGLFLVQIRSLNTLYGGGGTSPTTFSLSGEPLYIVDGVEYPASSLLGMINNPLVPTARIGGNALNYLDPALIESINVLKGADATAIYGSRGAFGVVLISMKKAKPGKQSVNLDIVHGFSKVGKFTKMMSTEEYLALRHEAFASVNITTGPFDYDLNGTWDTTHSTNWKDFYMGEHAPITKVNVTYSGGNANTNFLLGTIYRNSGNVQLSGGSVKAGGVNFSINTNTPDRKFATALSGSYTTNVDNIIPVDFSIAMNTAPNAPYPFLPNGQVNWVNNPTNRAGLLNMLYRNNTDNLLANATLTFTPIRGLTFTIAGGFHLLSAKEFNANPSTVFDPATFDPNQRFSAINQYRFRTISADPRVEYSKSIGDRGRLSVTAGASLRDQENQSSYIAARGGFITDALIYDPSNANSANISTSYRVIPNRYVGAFAILNFRWADKYILSLNGRRDGSSVFGNNRQFGNFGSVAGAWIISEESWFKPIKDVIHFLKLKASYGLVGGSSIPPYSYANYYGITDNAYGGGLAASPQNLSNPYLHWETNKNFEAGLNIELVKGRINLDAIFYLDKVGDQLIDQPLSSITGFTQVTVNSPANIHSYGTEVTLNTMNVRSKNFTWITRINVTLPRTKLISYPHLDGMAYNINYVLGKPITGIKLFQYAGVNPSTGSPTFYTAAGAKVEYSSFLDPFPLDENHDRVAFIDFAPKFYGGILNELSYKNFSLDFQINIIKRMGPNYFAYHAFPLGSSPENFPSAIGNRRWNKPGDIADIPGANASIVSLFNQNALSKSTAAYSDATYARLQNLSITYRFSSEMIRCLGMSELAIYFAGQNLFTLSQYKDFDPEHMTANHLPPLQTYVFGINVTF